MASPRLDPNQLLIAMTHIQPDLPSLLGAVGWAAVGTQITAQIDQLRDTLDNSERLRLSITLVETIAPYAALRAQLQAELYLLADLRRELNASLATSAERLAITPISQEMSLTMALRVVMVKMEESSVERMMYLESGGIGGARLVRLRNLQLDLGELFELAANSVLTLAGVVEQPHPLLVALAVLLTVRSLYKIISIDIAEQEASVFWGVLHACGRRGDPAKEADIVEQTNKFRARMSLGTLTDDAIKTSLHLLKRLNVVEVVTGSPPMWRFVEQCEIQG